jgi:sulfatase maturation enzyme AslB (radical SAM superfamily)
MKLPLLTLLLRCFHDQSHPPLLRCRPAHGSPALWPRPWCAATAAERRPIVVWNITRRCNLKCLHCYQDSDSRHYPGELDWQQCQGVVDDLAQFKVPALLLSGGEPMIHPRFFELAEYATGRGLRLTLSTNGTLIRRRKGTRSKTSAFPTSASRSMAWAARTTTSAGARRL